MKITMISITCPKCGGAMNVSNDHNLITCPYCQEKLLIKSDAEVELKKAEYELESDKLKANQKIYEYKKERTETIVLTIAVVFGFAIFAVIFLALAGVFR